MQNEIFELNLTIENVAKNLSIMLPENIKVQQRITDTYGKTIDNPAELYVTLNDMCMKPIDPENDKEGMIGISLVKVQIDDYCTRTANHAAPRQLHPVNCKLDLRSGWRCSQ